MKTTDLKAINIDPASLGTRPTTLHLSEPTPYLIYSFLKDLYGEPIRSNESRYTQWEFRLQTQSALISIRDWNKSTWLLDIYHDQNNEQQAKQLGQAFLNMVQTQSGKYRAKIKQLTTKPRYKSIQNPFQIYFASAEHLLELASQAVNTDAREDLCRSAFFLFLSSFEGLLNMIYDLYLKPFLNDDRIRSTLTRANIDIKLKLAPLYCVCFSGDTLQHTGDVLKRYKSIVELRNDFIHANMSDSLKTPIIKQDGYLFFVDQMAQTDHNIPKALSALEIKDLEVVKSIIWEMANVVVDSMNHKYQHDFRLAMKREYIMIEEVNGENLIRSSI